jgi:hypothetical protein
MPTSPSATKHPIGHRILEELTLDVNAGQAIGGRKARSVADQAAGHDVSTILIDRRNGIA